MCRQMTNAVRRRWTGASDGTKLVRAEFTLGPVREGAR
jgi:hypothetical protein